MTKNETALLVMRSSEFYADCHKAFSTAKNAELDTMLAIKVAVESGIRGAYATAFQAGMDVYEAAEYKAPRQRVLYMMRLAGISAPGKNGKRGKKAVEPVAATLEAWVACYKTADAKTAAKIAKQLGW